MPKKEATVTNKKKVAIALQGGGSHGAFGWGVLDALLENQEMEIVGLSGTSAGAMNSAALLQGYIKGGSEGAREELARYWNLVTEKALVYGMVPTFLNKFLNSFSLRGSPAFENMNFFRNFFSPYQWNINDINPLRELVRDFFDFDLINKAKSPRIFLCATHVKTGKLKIFEGHSLKEEALLASACLPSLFKAVNVDGEYYWDGGYIGNPAIYPLIYNTDAIDIIAILLVQTNRSKIPKTKDEISERRNEITLNSCLVREMRTIHFITELIDKGIIKDPSIKRLNMHLIRNADFFQDLDESTVFNMDADFINYLFEEGRKTGEKWLSENLQYIGLKSTATIEKDFI